MQRKKLIVHLMTLWTKQLQQQEDAMQVLNDGVFQLERVHDQNEQEIISAENYNNLIHSDKEPGGMESGKVQFRHKH